MKLLILAAMAATLTLCSLDAQQTPTAPAKAEQTATKSQPKAPVLTAEQKLKIRDAQVPAMKAAQELSAYVQRIQQLPEYQRLKAAADALNQKLETAASEALKAADCADCQLDGETLALTRPQLAAKAEEKK